MPTSRGVVAGAEMRTIEVYRIEDGERTSEVGDVYEIDASLSDEEIAELIFSGEYELYNDLESDGIDIEIVERGFCRRLHVYGHSSFDIFCREEAT